MQLTQKETSFLKDLKEQEQTCVEKYNKYATEAYDGQLLIRHIVCLFDNHGYKFLR